MENEYLSHIRNWWGDLHYSSLQKRGLAIIAGLVILITALFVFRGSSQEVAAAPALAIISVGTGNSYGHPAASTISALTDLHAKVLRTDIDGAVAIRAERHRLSIQRSKRWLRFFFWS